MNDKFENAIFDTIMEQAFEEAIKEEISELEKDAELYSHVQPTQKHKKETRRLYNRILGKTPKWINVMKRTAAIILIVFCTASGVAFMIPSVHAALLDSIATFFEKYIAFDFSSSGNSLQLNTCTLNYFPANYELINVDENQWSSMYSFACEEKRLYLRCMTSNILNYCIDNEGFSVVNIKINDKTAYIMTTQTDEKMNMIVWGDESSTYVIMGNEKTSELIKIAENLQ